MTVAFDFDGVVYSYVKQLFEDDWNVFILSTRSKRQIYKYMKNKYYDNTPEIFGLPCNNVWTCGFGFRIMPPWEKFVETKVKDGYKLVGICNHKAIFDVLIDDRAINFDGSYFGLADRIRNFKPWMNVAKLQELSERKQKQHGSKNRINQKL